MSAATQISSAPMESMESFAALFEESLSRQEMRQGEVITAEVISIDDNFVDRERRTQIREPDSAGRISQ